MVSEYFDGKQLTLSISPDEAVAYGAAVEADIMMSEVAPLPPTLCLKLLCFV